LLNFVVHKKLCTSKWAPSPFRLLNLIANKSNKYFSTCVIAIKILLLHPRESKVSRIFFMGSSVGES
jgi:hypothetical protein